MSPRGIPKSKNPELYGGSTATATAEPVLEVRDQITQMSGFSSAEDLEKVIPENTLDGNPERKRRTRKPKDVAEPVAVDPLMQDAQYRRACERLNGFGGPTALKTVFSATGKPLDNEEEADVKAYFYIMSKRFTPLDPSQSVIGMVIMAFLLIGRLIYVRMEIAQSMWTQFSKLFEAKEEEEKEKESEEENE